MIERTAPQGVIWMVVKVMSLWFSKPVLLKSSEIVGMGLPPGRAQSNMRLIFYQIYS